MTLSLRAMIIAGALTAALFASGLLVIVTPLPICVLVARGHRADGASAACIAAALLATIYLFVMPLLLGATTQWMWVARLFPLPGLGLGEILGVSIGRSFASGYFAYYCFVGWMVGEGFSRQWKGTRSVAVVTVIVAAAVAVIVGGVEWVTHGAVIRHAELYFRRVMEEFVRMMGESGVAAEQIALLRSHAEGIVAEAVRLLPAFCWATGLYVTTVNVLCGRWLLRSYGIGRQLAPFAQWRAPFGVVWVLIGSGVAFFADRYIVHSHHLATVGLNGLLGCVAIYLLQGFAVMYLFLQRTPAWWRWIVYAMTVLWLQVAGPMLVLVGLADTWVDFRKYVLKKQRS